MKILSTLLSLFFILNSAYSEEEKSIEIIANTMEWNKKERKAIASGNASAIKGETIIVLGHESETIKEYDNDDPPYRIKLMALNIPVNYKSIALRKMSTLDSMEQGTNEYYKLNVICKN